MNRTHLLALMTLLSSPVALAVEATEPEPTGVTEAPEVTTAPPPGPADQPGQAEPGDLKQPDLGEALRNFRPSEEISADNAVAFPVDI